MLEQVEIERLVEELYRIAGFDGDEPVAPETLVRVTMGDRALRFVDGSVLRHNAAVARVGTEWRVYLRRGLPDVTRRFSVAHELSEWFLARLAGVDRTHIEQSADCMAAAVLAPKPYAARVCKKRGGRWRQLALDFGCTESCAALRFGEVTGKPLALATRFTVRERGEPIPWPSLEELQSPGMCPGIRKARLRDDMSRVVARKTA